MSDQQNLFDPNREPTMPVPTPAVTSAEALKVAIASGLMSAGRASVAVFVERNQDLQAMRGGVSRRDVSHAFGQADAGDSYCRRLEELERMGVVECVGTKPHAVGDKHKTRQRIYRLTDCTNVVKYTPPPSSRLYAVVAGWVHGPFDGEVLRDRFVEAQQALAGVEVVTFNVRKSSGEVVQSAKATA